MISECQYQGQMSFLPTSKNKAEMRCLCHFSPQHIFYQHSQNIFLSLLQLVQTTEEKWKSIYSLVRQYWNIIGYKIKNGKMRTSVTYPKCALTARVTLTKMECALPSDITKPKKRMCLTCRFHLTKKVKKMYCTIRCQ